MDRAGLATAALRRKLGRVTRFRSETAQASRWLAYALLEVQKGFHRISGWRDLPALARALECPNRPIVEIPNLTPKKRGLGAGSKGLGKTR